MAVKTPEYITVKETAEIWDVSKRWVNMCVTAGRVPGAVRTGNMWLIPRGAERPVDKRQEQSPPPYSLSIDFAGIVDATIVTMPSNNPNAILDTISEDRLRLHLECELAYLRGEFARVADCFKRTNGDDASRLRASSITIAAAVSTGDYALYLDIESFLKNVVQANNNLGLSAFAELCLATAYTGAIAPNMAADWLKNGDFSMLHPLIRQDAAYKRAKYFQCIGQFEAMLITAQTALNFCEPEHGFISFHSIYFRVACAIACCGLGHTEEAKKYLLDAIRIALPHGFITPFAESFPAFGGLLETLLELEAPKYLDAASGQWKRTFPGWIEFHNRFTKDNVTKMLSLREYEIAQLLVRHVPRVKIAKQHNLSAGGLNNIIETIYAKLYISDRDQLAGYLI